MARVPRISGVFDEKNIHRCILLLLANRKPFEVTPLASGSFKVRVSQEDEELFKRILKETKS